jgi:DNA polymerase I-like protein with 3'-5' exonuclease and polymerase domains
VTKRRDSGTMSLFPRQSEWLPPQSFPNLSEAKEIAIDLETSDPHMETMGPGWPRKDGYVVGYAVAVDGWAGYFPVAHGGGGNLDRRIVERWLADVLATPADKIFHNAAYDLGWLRASGFTVNGRIIDTMLAAPLLDENRFSYALNSLGFDYLKETKSEQGLKEAAQDFGVHAKKELWKLPAMHVGEYAEQDAALTLKLWQHLRSLLRAEDIESIFNLETELLPILVDITYRGIRFDSVKCERLVLDMREQEKQLLQTLKSQAGMQVDIWAAASIATAFDKLGIEYPRTAQGAPSFTKSFLDSHDHPMAKMIVEARELNKTHGTFLAPYLEHARRDGRVHTHFNQLRSDDGGTVTGRLSAASPNLQQVPARHETIGPMVRSLFLPEEGQLWAANDFSSQEPRLLVHYATLLNLPGAEKMADAYRGDPNTDFHQMVADMAGIKRKAAKTIGLGLMYGMGKQKLANSLDLPLDEASELIGTFHQKVPFLRGTVDAVMRRIEHPASGGTIRTLLGRKCRFPLWEPVQYGVNKALPYEQAIMAYGQRVKRAGTYKGLNRLIQGSAADQTKAAMVALHKAGFKLLLQVHDEVALSVNSLDEAREAADIMARAVTLEVPSRVDVEAGPSWGEAV